MKSEFGDSQARRTFLRAITSEFEAVSKVRLAGVEGDGAQQTVPLWDVHVPLRSDLVASMKMADGAVTQAWLSSVGSTLVRVETARAPNGHSDFGTVLLDALQLVAGGDEPPGLQVRQRPLISAPLWADGLKADVADLETPAACAAFHRTIILGPPGSGKTTAAKAIAAAHLERLLAEGGARPSGDLGVRKIGLWPEEDRLPIFIELKDLVASSHFPELGAPTSARNLISYLESEVFFDDAEATEAALEYLENGRGIIILDGLDEVPFPADMSDSLGKRRSQLTDFVKSLGLFFPRSHIVITSRPVGYSDWTLPDFEVIRTRALSNAEAAALARVYYLAKGREHEAAERLADALARRLDDLPRTVSEFPLFVSLLAALYDRDEDDFPSQRGAILHESLRLLLGRWTTSPENKTPSGLNTDSLLNKLASTCLRSFTEDEPRSKDESPDIKLGTLFEEIWSLGRHVNPGEVVDFLTYQAGLIVSTGTNRVKFVHRLFHEYLVAYAMAHLTQDPVRGLADKVQANAVVWEEVGLLFADLLANERRAGDLVLLVDNLLESVTPDQTPTNAVGLAASIVTDQRLSTSVQSHSPTRLGMKERFAQHLDSPRMDAHTRLRVGQALSELCDDRAGVGVTHGVPAVDWRHVEGGCATIGTSQEEIEVISSWAPGRYAFDREHRHTVEVDSYRISRYPVTVAQFAAFVGARDGYSNSENWTESGLSWRETYGPPPLRQYSNAPQTMVSWYEAVAFCAWLSNRLGERVRLPTEIEWEFAAKSRRERLFAWGNDRDANRANVSDSGLGRAMSVGCMFESNRLLAADMNGNIWEWCLNVFDNSPDNNFGYPYQRDDRELLESGPAVFRATRGGYFAGDWNMARSSYRGRDVQSARFERQGFRVIMEAQR